MKAIFTKLILGALLLTISRLYAQMDEFSCPNASLKDVRSPLFGKDIVIKNAPDTNQRNISICSAFNGWLYAVYSYVESGFFTDLCVLKSTDGGKHWEVLIQGNTGIAGAIIPRTKILACGNSLSNLKLFFGYSYLDTNQNIPSAYIWRYNAEPFYFESGVLYDAGLTKDFDIAWDDNYTASGASPSPAAHP